MEYRWLFLARIAAWVGIGLVLQATGRAVASLPAEAITTPTTAPVPLPSASDGAYGDTLTGNWFGWRDDLAHHGVSFAGGAISDESWNLRGGLSTQKTIARVQVNLGVALDTKRLLGWSGGKLNATVRFQFGSNANNLQLGSIQGFSLMDNGAPRIQLYDFYYRQRLFQHQLSVRIGTMDANAFFDIPADASDFANPSATDPPLYLQNAPPFVAPALEVTWHPAPLTTLLMGAFYNNRFHPSLLDTMLNTLEPVNQPVGTFYTMEVDQAYRFGARMPGMVGIGGFWRTGKLPKLNGNFQSGAGGGYLFVDQTIWQSRHAIHRLAFFGNVTGNDPHVSEIDCSLQTGMLDVGPIPGRDHDKIGLGLDWAHISSLAATPKPYELVTEVFYELACGHGMAIQPDLQYFINTGGGTHPDGLIALIRVSVEF